MVNHFGGDAHPKPKHPNTTCTDYIMLYLVIKLIYCNIL